MAKLYKKRFKILDLFENDGYISTFEAYDTVKKCYCYFSSPNNKSSWDYSITY